MKTYCFIVILLILNSLSGLAQVPDYVPKDSLLGWWSFTGNSKDSSGNNNHGEVNGNAILKEDRKGNANCAYEFMGADDNISIQGITLVNVNKYTVTGWFRKTVASLDKEGTIFCTNNPLVSPGLRFHIGGTNQAAWGAEMKEGSVWSYSKDQNYADGQWHFFAVVLDANNGEINSSELLIYIDGLEIPKEEKTYGDFSVVIAPISNQNIPTLFGNVPQGNDVFQGRLDDIGIWNRVLTKQEITDLYDGVVVGEEERHMKVFVSIYPNPANHAITISNINLLATNYTVTDQLGRQVINGKLNLPKTTIDVEQLKSGVYFIKAGTSIGKFIKH